MSAPSNSSIKVTFNILKVSQSRAIIDRFCQDEGFELTYYIETLVSTEEKTDFSPLIPKLMGSRTFVPKLMGFRTHCSKIDGILGTHRTHSHGASGSSPHGFFF